MFELLKVYAITAHLGVEYDFHPILTGLEIRRRIFKAEQKILLKQLGGSVDERPYPANHQLAKAA